ncbi:SAC3/GANP family protein [Dictyocaulus viviparus]|uniref:SAC3/GANP family protein n=1 Tax=Dictyocaulus viviparus TaxID=29172 RepID=A0A0D8X968_DICVI|nr:SAC3/GANP family protein [Dictyocaulus viviparus]
MKSIISPVIAKCMTMCPEKEERFRIRNKMIHPLERFNTDVSKCSKNESYKMIKEYRRSAAGSDHLDSSALRPPVVLLETVRYLLDLYCNEKDSRYNLVYSFVCDRLRAVRQDMILQRCSPLESARILQEMIPFYFETNYLCRIKKCDVFDWKLHATQLEECLSKWVEASTVIPCDLLKNEVICSYILYNIPNPSNSLDLYKWRNSLVTRRFAFYVTLYFHFVPITTSDSSGDSFQLPSNSLLMAAVQAIQIIRRRALHVIVAAYRSPNSKIPMSTISRWLHYNDCSNLLSCFSVPKSDYVSVSSINMNDNNIEDSNKCLAEIDVDCF